MQELFKHVHIIGIGGAGMSAIARILLESGVHVSGSDRQMNETTQALAREGAAIFGRHAAENIATSSPDIVLISSAIKDDNPEIVAAHAAGIPVLTRQEAFRYLLPGKTQIAVAGTHGKTTTTALIVHLLRETGHDPSYIVGGVMLNTGDNAHVGSGEAFVVEADEYGEMFLGLTPQIAVITNIEHDHPDIFPTFEDVMAAFRRFVALLPDDGMLIVGDDPNAITLAEERDAAGKPVVGFAREILVAGAAISFFSSPALIGAHNVKNALAALYAIKAFGVSFDDAIPALSTFKGTGRRFEIMGVTASGVIVVNDYGHHSTKIRATLQAARQRYPNQKIWAVWQPHTYSRTKLLVDAFAHAFADADHVLITDIFAAREQRSADDPTEETLERLTRETGHPDARYSGDLAATAGILEREARAGDVVIIFSAGDAPKIASMLLGNDKS